MLRTKWALARRYLPFLRPHLPFIGAIVGIGILQLGVSLVTPWMSKVIIDHILIRRDGTWTLGQAMALLGASFALGIGLQFLRGLATAGLWVRMVRDLRGRLYRHLQTLSPGYYDNRQAGAVASRLTSDVEGAQQLISGGALQLIVDALIVLMAGIMVLYLHWKLALLCLAILPLYYLTFRRFNGTIRTAWRQVHAKMEKLSGDAVERLSGVRIVQAFGREETERQRFEEQSAAHVEQARRAFLLSNLFGRMNQAYSDAGKWLIWFAGALFVLRGELTLGSLIAFQAYLGQLYGPIYRFSELNVTIQNALAHVERIFEVLDTEPDIRSKPGARPMTACQGDIRFEEVSFGYPAAESGEPGREVLRSISFHARPGEVVALVGPSGAGKSTLVQLLPRFYDPRDGRVLIDGGDLRDYRLEEARGHMAVVLQDNILFSGTVYENIAYGRPEASPEEVQAAAAAANAHGFISAWEEGYGTLVGERGLRLSGGQKQRIAIARALLKNPRILILDEATSALDAESEALVTGALDTLMKGRTTLIIAHRLATVVRADQILVMDEGRIVDRGTHGELLQRSGLYRELYEKQLQAMKAEAFGALSG
ncbi:MULTISPECIES: ABC transporter ATP-binding protein [Paenibacillus]|uniref:ABC transporter ATP-binding protein n=1 Tax=Paenibacillus TaxID=44249 RepID=UPI0022B90B26|nr:ABC transporter ATP-binding protein [Paenibacillus caseinilyticus]MCZ8522141.1 ABC transporter ATP-binding protein [Paenibacillus caseinilyticus]